MAHDRHKPYSNPQTQQLGEDMQVGDLVISKNRGTDEVFIVAEVQILYNCLRCISLAEGWITTWSFNDTWEKL
jgi:hypothetical protein